LVEWNKTFIEFDNLLEAEDYAEGLVL